MEVDMNIDELVEVIDIFYQEFSNITELWKNQATYKNAPKYNFKKVEVIKIHMDEDFLLYTESYRNFLNQNSTEIQLYIEEKCKNISIESRVKNSNSLLDKLERYCTSKHEDGKVPVYKCLNDLFGLRINLAESPDLSSLYCQLVSKLDTKKYRLTDSSKNGYNALHVYFKFDNSTFQWELQIWRADDINSNHKCHDIYKQDYTSWESQVKEVKQ